MNSYLAYQQIPPKQKLKILDKQEIALRKAYNEHNESYYIRMLKALALKQEQLSDVINFEES